MPETNHDPYGNQPLEELWNAAQLHLEEVVRNALRRYLPTHQADDVERFKQRLKLMLWAGAQNLLGDVQDEAKLKPWLQQVANHEVIRVLKEEGRKVSFDDAPPEVFIQPPTQEKLLLQKERSQLLEEALPKLTPRERKLVRLDTAEFENGRDCAGVGHQSSNSRFRKVSRVECHIAQ